MRTSHSADTESNDGRKTSPLNYAHVFYTVFFFSRKPIMFLIAAVLSHFTWRTYRCEFMYIVAQTRTMARVMTTAQSLGEPSGENVIRYIRFGICLFLADTFAK